MRTRSLAATAAVPVVAVAALAALAAAPGCGDSSGSCVRPPGCPTSTLCCSAQIRCAAVVCQGISYSCRADGSGGFAWRADDVCDSDGGGADGALDGARDSGDGDATLDAPGDGAATDGDASDDAADATPGDGPDGPKPDAGCPWGKSGNGNDPCNGVPAETWRCVHTTEFGGTTVSQVCRNGKWVNYHLQPRDCAGCCNTFTDACKQ